MPPENALPKHKLARLILNTDAKNEADDQYCIVQALLTPSFQFHGIIPAHFGVIKSKTQPRGQLRGDAEAPRADEPRRPGAGREGARRHALADEATPQPSPGARFIIDQAMKDDPRPLYVAFLGPLTDMASALLMEPTIADRNVIVVWIGGGYWPVGLSRVQPPQRHPCRQCRDEVEGPALANSDDGLPHDGRRLRRTLRARPRQGRDRQVSRRATCRMECECTRGRSSIARSAIPRR